MRREVLTAPDGDAFFTEHLISIYQLADEKDMMPSWQAACGQYMQRYAGMRTRILDEALVPRGYVVAGRAVAAEVFGRVHIPSIVLEPGDDGLTWVQNGRGVSIHNARRLAIRRLSNYAYTMENKDLLPVVYLDLTDEAVWRKGLVILEDLEKTSLRLLHEWRGVADEQSLKTICKRTAYRLRGGKEVV